MSARIIPLVPPARRATVLRRMADARRVEATQLRQLGEERAASDRLADALALDEEASRIERHEARLIGERRKIAAALESILERAHRQRRAEGLEDESGREIA